MSFPRYPRYKDSGVEWLGKVPEHWAIPPLYLRYEVVLGKMLDTKRLTGEHSMPYLRNADVQWDRVDVSELPEIDITPEEVERFTVRKGDILVCEGGEVGRTAIWRGEVEICAFQKAIHRLRPQRPQEAPRFFYYCMRFAAANDVFIIGGNPNTIPHLTGEKFRLYRFPTPPREEQIQIAAFLDHETAKIDALVAEQRRLIELLKEKRQAVVSHAVTKGLDPNVPMKPSGVEWLGEVPAHWEIKKLSYLLVDSPKNGISPEITAEGTTPTFSIAAVRNGSVDIGSYLKYVSLDLADAQPYIVKQHDILVLRGNGSKDLVGTAGIVSAVPPENCIYPDILIRIRPSKLVLASHLVACLNSNALRPQIQTAAQTASGIWKISGSSLKALHFPLPPSHEQQKIDQYLREDAAKFDTLTSEAERAIDLLQERRTALISAAVTGQIDVRGLVESPAP